MIRFKINNQIKAIKYIDKDCNCFVQLQIEQHKSINNHTTINISEKDINKINQIINL